MSHSVYGCEKADVEFNMTPMIDVTFQLIIFFILAGSFASMDVARLTVPKIWRQDKLLPLKIQNKAVVNILPYPEDDIRKSEADDKPETLKGKALRWQLRSMKWGPREKTNFKLSGLVDALKALKSDYTARQEADPSLKNTPYEVELRADASLNTGEVHKVLRAISEAGFKKINYVVVTTKDIR